LNEIRGNVECLNRRDHLEKLLKHINVRLCTVDQWQALVDMVEYFGFHKNLEIFGCISDYSYSRRNPIFGIRYIVTFHILSITVSELSSLAENKTFLLK
jgi:hypothetical protein